MVPSPVPVPPRSMRFLPRSPRRREMLEGICTEYVVRMEGIRKVEIPLSSVSFVGKEQVVKYQHGAGDGLLETFSTYTHSRINIPSVKLISK
jgi:hypothetical protein